MHILKTNWICKINSESILKFGVSRMLISIPGGIELKKHLFLKKIQFELGKSMIDLPLSHTPPPRETSSTTFGDARGCAKLEKKNLWKFYFPLSNLNED